MLNESKKENSTQKLYHRNSAMGLYIQYGRKSKRKRFQIKVCLCQHTLKVARIYSGFCFNNKV